MSYPPLVRELRARLGDDAVLWAPSEMAVYDCDAMTAVRRRPEVVVLPSSAEQVAEVVRIAGAHQVPIVPRAAGTSLVGGCVPIGGGIVLVLTRLNHILEVNLRDRMAWVEAGVTNLQLMRRLAGTGYHYAPDPASENACTIGGNVATNAGGPHTLKYGVTVNHVLGLELVRSDGSIVQLGPMERPDEMSLISLLVGSEGTLGIVTKVWVRLTRDPQHYCTFRAVFDSIDQATDAVGRILAAGVIPAAIELMDHNIVRAVEEAHHFGFPADAGAVLVIELDGPAAAVEVQRQPVTDGCLAAGAREVLDAESADERALLWKCRKSAGGAVGRLSPAKLSADGVVPRCELPEIVRRIGQIAEKHQLRITIMAHAGDGNIHPGLLYDDRDPEQTARVLAASEELLEQCIELGGSITAEHGVGIEKVDLMRRQFAVEDLAAMTRLRLAFDPTGRFNPGKVLPSGDQRPTVPGAPR